MLSTASTAPRSDGRAARVGTRGTSGASLRRPTRPTASTPYHRWPMTVLLETHPAYLRHDAGPRHPERPARLEAVLSGIAAADLGEAVEWVSPEPAGLDAIERVHP